MDKARLINLAGPIICTLIPLLLILIFIGPNIGWASGAAINTTTQPTTRPTTAPSGRICDLTIEIVCQGRGSSDYSSFIKCCNKTSERCGVSEVGFPLCFAQCNASQLQCGDYDCCDKATEDCVTDEYGMKSCVKTVCGQFNKTTCHGTGDFKDIHMCCKPGNCDVLPNGAPVCKCDPGFSGCIGTGDNADIKVCCNVLTQLCRLIVHPFGGGYGTSDDMDTLGRPFCAKKCTQNQTFCQGTLAFESNTLCCNQGQTCTFRDLGPVAGKEPYCKTTCNATTENNCAYGLVNKCCSKTSETCVIQKKTPYCKNNQDGTLR